MEFHNVIGFVLLSHWRPSIVGFLTFAKLIDGIVVALQKN